jgi:CubicO group peptidase (beta-lactamase class C family)
MCTCSRTLLVATGLLALAVIAPASAASPEGHWEGSIQLPGQELTIDVDLSRADDAWTGDITIPAQGAKDLSLEQLAIGDVAVAFTITGVPGAPTFRGTLSEDGKTLTGDFTQAGQTFPFSLMRGVDPTAKARDAVEGLDAVIEKALSDWHTPGLALGVVHDGEAVLSRGFGMRNREENLPVTSKTVFAIGSSTKAMTAFTLATLVDEGKVEWDEPVRSYLARFQLKDEFASAHVTPRDLLTHRTGLPRHDLVWYNNEAATRAEIVERLRHLEPSAELRETWQYNNLMFLTAGHLTEVVTGMRWEDAVRARLLDPLGMAHTNFSVLESQESGDFAFPYLYDDDVLRRVDFRPLTLAGPAGSINSCADDMVQWLKLNLGGGKLGDRPLISPGTLRELHTPQMVIAALPDQPHASPMSYAMGWFVDSWYGHLRISHGGNIDGFSALVTFFPNDGLGIVALSNRNADAVPGLAVAEVADRFLGVDEKEDRFAKALSDRDRMATLAKQGESDKARFRKKGTKPSHPLEALAGDYHNAGYGTIEVRQDRGRLSMVLNGMTMPLEHWHYDVFAVPEVEDAVIPENIRIAFETNGQGNVGGLTAGLEPAVDPIRFDRQPDRKLSDPTFLARLCGAYDLPPENQLVLSVKGTTLFAEVTGQTPFELVPSGSDEFVVKDAPSISLRYTLPKEGPAKEVLLVQPEGVYTLPRK